MLQEDDEKRFKMKKKSNENNLRSSHRSGELENRHGLHDSDYPTAMKHNKYVIKEKRHTSDVGYGIIKTGMCGVARGNNIPDATTRRTVCAFERSVGVS